MSDQTEYVDPASQFPAGLPTDAALLVLHNRLTALEEATDNVPQDQPADAAEVDRPLDPYDQATADQRRRFAEWLASGEPDSSVDRPGLTGSPAGSPAGPVSTGAGPENPAVVAVGNTPDPTPDAEPDPTPVKTAAHRRAGH